MREEILVVCLTASGLVNLFLLWLNWRVLHFAGTVQKQRDEAYNARLRDLIGAPQ